MYNAISRVACRRIRSAVHRVRQKHYHSNEDKLRHELNYKLNYKFELRIKAVCARARAARRGQLHVEVTRIIRRT